MRVFFSLNNNTKKIIYIYIYIYIKLSITLKYKYLIILFIKNLNTLSCQLYLYQKNQIIIIFKFSKLENIFLFLKEEIKELNVDPKIIKYDIFYSLTL